MEKYTTSLGITNPAQIDLENEIKQLRDEINEIKESVAVPSTNERPTTMATVVASTVCFTAVSCIAFLNSGLAGCAAVQLTKHTDQQRMSHRLGPLSKYYPPDACRRAIGTANMREVLTSLEQAFNEALPARQAACMMRCDAIEQGRYHFRPDSFGLHLPARAAWHIERPLEADDLQLYATADERMLLRMQENGARQSAMQHGAMSQAILHSSMPHGQRHAKVLGSSACQYARGPQRNGRCYACS